MNSSRRGRYFRRFLAYTLDYKGLLAIEVDFLHPDYGDEDRAVAKSVKYLRGILHDGKAIRSR